MVRKDRRGSAVILVIAVVSEGSLSRDRSTSTKPMKYARTARTARRTARHPPSGHRAVACGGTPQRTKMPAWLARFRKYWGATPSTSVTATPTPIAVMVSGEGTATVGPSGRGSLKNIRTITRM